jgi:hypothetical protein
VYIAVYCKPQHLRACLTLYTCACTLVTPVQAYAKQQHAAKQARAGAGFGRYSPDGMPSQHENMMLATFIEFMMAAIGRQQPASSRAADVEEL